MTQHYIAIVEDSGPEKAIGLWFPDLPGCFAAGDTVEEAMELAPQAIALYVEALQDEGKPVPRARGLAELKDDSEFEADVRDHMIALVAVPTIVASAAE